jgi:hypothetical protein
MPIHEEIASAIHALSASMDQRHLENITAQSVTERKVDEVIRRVDDLHKAFPGGDWEGHRRYHEGLIRKMEARTEFYEDLRSELAKKGVWAVLVLVGLAMWQFLKTKVTS